MTSGLTFLDMSDSMGVRWYQHGGERLGYTMIISFLGIFPVCLIIHGTGHPVRWALLIPGAVLVAAIAAWARVPLRAGIGVTPDRILIRTAAGDTTAVPWAQVSGFEGGKGSSTRDSEGTVYVLTSGGERLHTAGYSAPRTAATELWQLLRALDDERLARMPGAVSTVPASPPPPPPPTPGKSYAAPLLAGLGVILLIATGTLPLYFGVTGIGPGLRAASGGGTAGYYTPQRETTGKGAQWYGEFRLPDGTVTRRDTGIEDVSMGALRTGVPVAARDTGYFDGVFPRDDPGAWHGPADMFAGAAWFYTATLVVLIRLRILSRRRDRNDDDGNVTAAPSAGHQNLRAQDVPPRASCWLGMPNRVICADERGPDSHS
jgi:hypothetical protein